MTIENGAEQAANDTALPGDDQIEASAPDEVEVEYEGKTYCLPAELKEALLRQADYTRKTQEVAKARKALEAETVAHHGRVSGARAHMQDAARVVALNDQLGQFDQIDWRALQQQDPARAQLLPARPAQVPGLPSFVPDLADPALQMPALPTGGAAGTSPASGMTATPDALDFLKSYEKGPAGGPALTPYHSPEGGRDTVG